MKVLIASDMEGITGVVHWDHVTPGTAEYPRFRRLMTADVNAAIAGAFDGGATEVVVTDGHGGTNRNILIEELDPRVVLNSGDPAPLWEVQGVDGGVDAVMFIGYHSMAGTTPAVLDHTFSSPRVAELKLNGARVGEIGMNAALCGHFGVPVTLLAGDDAACREAHEILGDVELVAVKKATGRYAAECVPPAASQERIRAAAQRAMTRHAAGAREPFRPRLPLVLTIEFVHTEQTDRAQMFPTSRRISARVLEVTAPDVLSGYRAFRAAVSLAAQYIPPTDAR